MNRIQFPTLAKALEEMALDNGMQILESEQDVIIKAACLIFSPHDMIRAEKELGKLIQDGGDDFESPFYELCCGCEDDWPPVQDNTLRVLEVLFDCL